MTTPQILLLAATGISVVVSFIMKMPSAKRGEARKLLAATDWLDDESADGSQVKVTGTVKVREHGERFVSPLADSRCVVLRHRVLVRHGQNPRAKLVEDFKIMPFVLECDGDRIVVDAEHALLDIGSASLPRNVLPQKTQLMTALGHDGANITRSEFEETYVEVGQRVTIAGTLAKEGETRITGTKDKPIAIRLERATNIAAEP